MWDDWVNKNQTHKSRHAQDFNWMWWHYEYNFEITLENECSFMLSKMSSLDDPFLSLTIVQMKGWKFEHLEVKGYEPTKVSLEWKWIWIVGLYNP
jgi:hypothetical protein